MCHCYLLLYFILEFNIHLLTCDRGFNHIFELLILLSKPLKCWDYRHVPPSPVTDLIFLMQLTHLTQDTSERAPQGVQICTVSPSLCSPVYLFLPMAVPMSLLQPQLVTSPLPLDFPQRPGTGFFQLHRTQRPWRFRTLTCSNWEGSAVQSLACCQPETSPSRANHSSTKTSPLRPEPAHPPQSQPCLLKKPPEVVSDPGQLAMPFQGLSDATQSLCKISHLSPFSRSFFQQSESSGLAPLASHMPFSSPVSYKQMLSCNSAVQHLVHVFYVPGITVSLIDSAVNKTDRCLPSRPPHSTEGNLGLNVYLTQIYILKFISQCEGIWNTPLRGSKF